ncbi:unnamed protein product [Schistocephalus solidus]|uniref:Secreted protein n=1 Tax=Schistocephalus solidus TaxID=70667 RepID=A0A183SH69_SCHSO|nr:unnamed protein product [Schistocephalus solidus]
MLLWPPLAGTQLSPMAPRSWILLSGHTPGNRQNRRAKLYEDHLCCVYHHTRPLLSPFLPRSSSTSSLISFATLSPPILHSYFSPSPLLPSTLLPLPSSPSPLTIPSSNALSNVLRRG